MYLLNGIKLDITRPFTGPDGTKYPHLRPPEYRDMLGVTEVPDPVYPDPEKFTYTENPDGTLTPVEIPLDKIKKRRIRLFRSMASELFDTKYDLLGAVLVLSGQAPAGPTTVFKADILAIVNAHKTAAAAVNAATTADDVLAVNIALPAI